MERQINGKANKVNTHNTMLNMSQQSMQSGNVSCGMPQECGEWRRSTVRVRAIKRLLWWLQDLAQMSFQIQVVHGNHPPTAQFLDPSKMHFLHPHYGTHKTPQATCPDHQQRQRYSCCVYSFAPAPHSTSNLSARGFDMLTESVGTNSAHRCSIPCLIV